MPSLFLLSISAKVYNVTAAKINTNHSQLLTALLLCGFQLYMTCGLLTEDEFVKLVDWYILHYQESFQATQATSVVKKLEVAMSNECAN